MWIFKQINADSIRISFRFIFCCYCSLAFPVLFLLLLLYLWSIRKWQLLLCDTLECATCSKGAVWQGMGKGGGGREGSCVDFKYHRRRHMCEQQQKQRRRGSLGMRVSRLSLPLSPIVHTSLPPPARCSVVFLTQIALKIPCTLLSFAIFNGNCTILFSIFFCLSLNPKKKKSIRNEKNLPGVQFTHNLCPKT